MKFKCYENLLPVLFLFFLELIKRCSPSESIESVYPLIIPINTKKFENISFIIRFFEDIKNRTGKYINFTKIIQDDNKSFVEQFESIEEQNQDQNMKRKIEFKIDLKKFENHYGKYKVIYINNNNIIQCNETIFIYANELILINPKHKYFLTGNGIAEGIKYDFSLPIKKEEIKRIEYYDEQNQSNKTPLQSGDYKVEDDNKLVLKFPRTNKSSLYIFDIYPEYDEESNPETQRFYLSFHDYLLKNDAIYINKKNNTNEIPFNLTFRNNNTNGLIINGFVPKIQFLKKNIESFDYEITINLGYRNEPGKIYMSYYNQNRELFYILYSANFSGCYEKNDTSTLEIVMEWNDEMAYAHSLYFIDTSIKPLIPKLKKTGSIVSYAYQYSILNLKSGIYTLKSSIPSLSNCDDYNPVDDNNLYFYINPNSDTFDNETVLIYTYNNSNQYLNITSPTDPNGIDVLTEIMLTSEDKKTNISIQNKKPICESDNGILYCDLKDIIKKYDDNIIGTYSISYKSACNNSFPMNNKKVIIEKGITLSDISPRWVNKSNDESYLILTYEGDITNSPKICFTKEKKLENVNNCIRTKNLTQLGNGKLNVTLNLDQMEEEIYYVKTEVGKLKFIEESKFFKVGTPLKFNFNHHFFVNNHEPENKLIITVNDSDIEDIDKKFGFTIVETIENETLSKDCDKCTTFYYPINKEGTIKFNYYDNDNFIIPINDSIVVVSIYSEYFSLNEKFCYYYKFDITINKLNSYKNILKIKAFFKNDSYNFSLYNSESNENKYTYNDKEIHFHELYKEFNLYISEGEEEDDIIYLYKSNYKIKFTNITTPEFLIDPNKTIVFSDVNCDLNSSTIIIKKTETPSIQNNLKYWKYDNDNRQLYFNISGDFYQPNRFRYYYYQIDNNNISKNYKDSDLSQTFVSKRLNDTNFEIKKLDKIGNDNDKINIINTEKDFYFPLLSILNTKIEKRIPPEQNETLNENNTDNEQYTIIYEYHLLLNDALTLNYLERNVEVWENRANLGNTIYYKFTKDNIINGSSLVISPKLFAFNNFDNNGGKYNITILYSDEKQKNFNKTYNNTNLKCENITDNLNGQNCFIKIEEKKSQKMIINIVDDNSNFNESIDFAYYYLDEKSKKCQTKNNSMNNITLYVDIPNPNLKDRINLTSPDIDIIGIQRNNSVISFILDGNNINLQATYLLLYTDDGELSQLFTLQELGINILPKYTMRFNNDQNETKLLAEDNQEVKVIISVENENANINLDDIGGFKIKGENNIDLIYDDVVVDKNTNVEPDALTLIFNLSKVNQSEENYSLYYFDSCGDDKKLFPTGLKIKLSNFTLKRKYFVLKNNKNSEYQNQTLIIEGPTNEEFSINVYKNGDYIGKAKKNSQNYNLSFTLTSIGDYTFNVINKGIESSIDGKVYVRENLEDILILKDNIPIPNCRFSNENKSEIKNFSYTITPSGINTNFTNFQSYFSTNPNLNKFWPLSSTPGKNKTFSINYSSDMKNNINLNNTLYIYLTENDDTDQPIYIFNYKYTNIKLHQNFTKFIYTDADYILFEMNCKIDNMESFVLKSVNSGEEYKISCEERGSISTFDERNGIFRCYLSDNNNTENKLLTISEYKDFNIKYANVPITNEPFFLSQDIYQADFNFKPPEEIGRNVSININVTTPKKIFYFPEIEKIIYQNNSNSITYTKSGNDLKYNNDNSISFDLFIISNVNYIITNICRKKCNYCKPKNGEETDCKSLNVKINSTTPEIIFKFDKHYVAIHNSSYKNSIGHNSTLTITATVHSPDDIKKLFYYHYTDKTHINHTDIINGTNNIFTLLPLLKGKYTFRYEYKNNKNYSIQDIVLVTDYDYEMFDFSYFSDKCIFYNSEAFLVSINANSTYDFKNDIIFRDLSLETNYEFEFPYEGGKGYKITNSQFNYNTDEFEKLYFKEKGNFVFTTLNNIKFFTIESYNLASEYYKDNIIFDNQNCKSNNIYIKSSANPGENSWLLHCNYSEKIQYCETDYEFSFKPNDYFRLYIGKNNLDTSLTINIYNSIKDSKFIVYYIISTVYIESSNFDMRNISTFSIDNINKTDFNSNLRIIYMKYPLESNTESWVNELWRKDHILDNKKDNIIKNKIINLKIESKVCPNHTILVPGDGANYCMLCKDKALGRGENGQLIWFQNNTCVEECSGNYSIFDDELKICEICDKRTPIFGKFYCGCLEGTVNHPTDFRCYLPEDPKIKESLLVRPNTQCYKIDGTTLNYCMENTTINCELISQSGADFPICHCKDGYTGKYCEIKKNEINLNNNIDVILNLNINDKINEREPYVISKIRGIVYFIEEDYSYTNSLSIDKINLFLNASMNSINEAIKDKDYNCTQIYDVIELTIHLLRFKIKNSERLRLLEEEEENKNNLKFVLENAHYLNYLANSHISSPYNIQADQLNLISFISYKVNSIDSGFKAYIKNKTYSSNIIGYSNLNYNDDKDIVILTLFNRKLFNLDSQDDDDDDKDAGLIVNISVTNSTISKNLRNFENVYIYIHSPNINVNFELAKYYQAKNINIYDKYDNCFTDACFTSENFDFDLTQIYRKKYVFQKWSLNNELCRYHSYENESNNIEILCQKFEDYGTINDSISYATLDLIGKKDYIDKQNKVYNLPMKCKKKLNSYNYGFWIFLIICILEIIYIIGITILTLGSLRRVSIRKGLINDGFFYKIPRIKNTDDEIESYNNLSIKQNKEEYYNNNDTFDSKSIGSYNKTLLENILYNFKELHPLSVFCRVSIISPLIMNSWFFVFNTLCLLGFNALIYYEGLIEKRIYDKKRNYFDYPMRKEFHKIILSILLQIALTAIIKAIILVFLNQYEDLESKLRKCKMKREEINNDIILRHDNFQDEMLIRRLIGGFLMTVIIIFFFYYTVVFCEVYLNTQRNLVFSWVWSLFWEWVIFAPIYIVIISVLEHKKANSKEPLIYYLKRLFFF